MYGTLDFNNMIVLLVLFLSLWLRQRAHSSSCK